MDKEAWIAAYDAAGRARFALAQAFALGDDAAAALQHIRAASTAMEEASAALATVAASVQP